MFPRTLVLRREALTPLDPSDLAALHGGTEPGPETFLRTARCPLSGLFSGMYPSINMDCTKTMDPSRVC